MNDLRVSRICGCPGTDTQPPQADQPVSRICSASPLSGIDWIDVLEATRGAHDWAPMGTVVATVIEAVLSQDPLVTASVALWGMWYAVSRSETDVYAGIAPVADGIYLVWDPCPTEPFQFHMGMELRKWIKLQQLIAAGREDIGYRVINSE